MVRHDLCGREHCTKPSLGKHKLGHSLNCAEHATRAANGDVLHGCEICDGHDSCTCDGQSLAMTALSTPCDDVRERLRREMPTGDTAWDEGCRDGLVRAIHMLEADAALAAMSQTDTPGSAALTKESGCAK